MSDIYNFTVNSKFKVGQLKTFPVVVGRFANESLAGAFKTWLQTKVANYATVHHSKRLSNPTDPEIPEDPSLTDQYDIVAILSVEVSPDKKLFVRLPGMGADDVSGIEGLGLMDAYGTEMDKLDGTILKGKNVVEGSYV